MRRTKLLLGFALGSALLASAPRPAAAQNTCNAFLAIGYSGGQNFAVPGDSLTVVLTLGSGDVQGGTLVTLDRVRFELDCDVSGPLGIGCTDDGAIVSYLGDATIQTTCAGITFASNVVGGGSGTNQVVFDASPNLVIPENTPNFCTLSFGVQVLSQSTDPTPLSIEEVAGFSVASSDAVCDNGLASSGSQSGSITLCQTCNDNNACTTETCNQTTGACDTTATTTCNDNNACTTEACNTSTGACDTTSTVTCNDNNACTTESCNTSTGACDTTNTTTCNDGDACTTESCNTATGACDTTSTVTCNDNNGCTTEVCNTTTGGCDTTSTTTCNDNNACTTESCNTSTGACQTTATTTCNDNNACTTESCNTSTGACDTTNTTTCDDGDACTTEVCNTSTGACDTTGTVTCDDPNCEECNSQTGSCEALDPLPQECLPVGCRITAGGITPDGRTDPGILADVRKATFGGQVGAPCGCIGCFDEFGHIQGEWTHVRHRRRGRLHASDYNSLVCGCDGVFDGNLCNPDDREPGPEPRPAPANMACWTGVGEFRREPVAFRVEVEDRGEPGAGKNADNTEDVYRIRIWIPTGTETPESLAAQVCCTIPEPDIRNPDVDDGGNIVHGNIQIHPQLKHSEEGVCPVPNGSCVE